MRLRPDQDAYGQMILAALGGAELHEIVEREDGFISASVFGPQAYLAPFRRWPAHHRQGMRYVRGRVLDVGAGGGRVALHLQDRGHDVVAVDISPGAVEACRRRGVRDARVVPVENVDESLGVFDTIVMYGNNLGLFASRATSAAATIPRMSATASGTSHAGECRGKSASASATATRRRRGSTT